MKVKLVVDFLDKKTYNLIKEIKNITKNKDLDIEIVGYDLNKKEAINNAYYGLWYTNRFGIGLDYSYIVLDYLHNKKLDVNDIEVLADIYESLSYNRYDMIDALIEGDFASTHEFMQFSLAKEKYTNSINAIIYKDNTKQIETDITKIIEILSN